VKREEIGELELRRCRGPGWKLGFIAAGPKEADGVLRDNVAKRRVQGAMSYPVCQHLHIIRDAID
jgi:hypothetical protein